MKKLENRDTTFRRNVVQYPQYPVLFTHEPDFPGMFISIRRRRECFSCAKRFTTYETVESLPMVVIKKDGSRQSFDRQKVLRGMIRACEKRPVPLAELERIADEIEQELQNSMEREIRTEDVGEKVMDRLRKVDQVAYVRFASVYRQFKDLDTFMAELNKLLAEK